MEASQAGLAGGDAAQQQGGEAQNAQQQGGPDVGALAQQLETLSGGQEELRQFLMSQPWQQQEPAGEEPETPETPLDLSQFLDPMEAAYDPQQLAERLSGYVQQEASRMAQEMVQQHIEPLKGEWSEMRVQQEAQMLVDEFPELGQPEVAEKVAGKGGVAEQLAQQLGMPELAAQPKFWRIAYIASRAMDAMQEEGAEDPRAAHLEGGGGARPSAPEQVDLGEQIVSARRGASVLPF